MQRRQSGANDPPLQAACVNGTLTVLSNATPSSPRYRAAWQMCHAWEWLSTDSKRSGTAEYCSCPGRREQKPSSSECDRNTGHVLRTKVFYAPGKHFAGRHPKVYLKSRKFSLFLQAQLAFALNSLEIHKGFLRLFALNPACACEIFVIFFVFRYTLTFRTCCGVKKGKR